MTGYASVDTAVEAVKLGATDYLTKPLDFGRLDQLLAGVREEIERRRSVLSLEGDLARRLEFYGMIGRGPRMQELFGMIRRLAPHVRTGAHHRRDRHRQGAGRARAAHASVRGAIAGSSPSTARRSNDTLFESELFGHVRGGVHSARPRTSRGCSSSPTAARCFSTRSASLPPTAQAKLLRVLELGEVTRVGALEPGASTSTSSPPPTATCAPKSRPAASAATSSIA